MAALAWSTASRSIRPNLLPNGTAAGLVAGEYLMYAGHAHGLTFASQMTKMETLRSEQTFGTIMRGLQVFGWRKIARWYSPCLGRLPS